MRTELTVKTKSLAGTSDLTLLAKIKEGLVPSLESVSYKTRVLRLLKALNTGRTTSHEYALLRPFSDAVERVGRIHSVRVAVFEPENQVLLAVTFDGAWESYIRVLWQKVGSLLDVIFCNTEGYTSACDNTFEAWMAWARSVQRETAFFYGTPGVTVGDLQYLRASEQLHRCVPRPVSLDAAAGAIQIRSVEQIASDASNATDLQQGETLRQALQALAFLYRLTDLYVPTQADGKFLHRATRDLLLEFMILTKDQGYERLVRQAAEGRFKRQTEWLLDSEYPSGRPLPSPLPVATPPYPAQDIQGGIVMPYEGATHGCLLLMGFATAAEARGFLRRVVAHITTDDQDRVLVDGAMAINLAFTYEGLRRVGLSEAQLAFFDMEFREGMEARASVLGDVRSNHPRRWRLPQRAGLPAATPADRVELSSVHIVVQLRAAGGDPADVDAVMRQFWAKVGGAVIAPLAVQPMRRHLLNGKAQEHFGFIDGDSQPTIAPLAHQFYNNQVHLGEMVIGYDNEADPAPVLPAMPPDDADSQTKARAEAERELARERLDWLRNGSYLVVRKLRQDVRALRRAAAAVTPTSGRSPEKMIDFVLEKMMGRGLDGAPLAMPSVRTNDFDYSQDADGSKCPFDAHVRRTNPRAEPADPPQPQGARTPRLARRGMSYGSRFKVDTPGDPVNDEERGLVFMAYAASIGEQFELVQRWISGGNSTNVYSGHSDPFLGVPENGQQCFFRFADGAAVVHMALDGVKVPLKEAEPFVRLEWGAYLFAPSMTVLRRLAVVTRAANADIPWSADKGARALADMPQPGQKGDPKDALPAWKELLEDPNSSDDFTTASVLAAIRRDNDGVLPTPYGVLVADEKILLDVLRNKDKLYSVSGYHERMNGSDSIGEIYLGLDADTGEYAAQSTLTNEAIQKLGAKESFTLARGFANDSIAAFVATSKAFPTPANPSRWDLNLDATEVIDEVLAKLCQHWFGLPVPVKGEPDPPLVPGRFRWDWKEESDKPTYPGHFTAPSRYLFQPRPSPLVTDFGRRYGAALTRAMQAFLAPHRLGKTVPVTPKGEPAPIAAAILKTFPDRKDDDKAARAFVGALMGFLPTIDGNLRLSLNEWLREGTLWALRTTLATEGRQLSDYERATKYLEQPLRAAMMLRPSPAMIWRRARTGHKLGPRECPVGANQTVALSIASATQQCLEEGRQGPEDIYPIFGGKRDPSSPSHACPGYDAAMGALLGILSAFVERPESMRASPAPLAFFFEGPLP